jgi:predicted double-glycine peptidase
MNTKRPRIGVSFLFASMLLLAGCTTMLTSPSKTTQKPKPSPNLLDIVDVRQATPYTCGVASSLAILNYYGIEAREDSLAERFGSTEEAGTSPQQIADGLASYGLEAILKVNTSLEDLSANLRNGIPTMVAIQAWLDSYPAYDWTSNWEDGHWVIVIGMDNRNIYFEDPSLLGTRGWMPKDEFLARWHDYAGSGPYDPATDKAVMQLSISVRGKPALRPSFTRIE